MKAQMDTRSITTFRALLEKLVREEAGKRLTRRRSSRKTLPPRAEPVETRE